MSLPTIEGFSITAARILDGTTGATALNGDIYGVREGTLAVDTGNFDNTGNDSVLSSWFWFNYANLTVQSGYVPFATVAMLSGSVLTSSGAAPNDFFSLPLWNKSSLNQPRKPVLLRIPAKDQLGAVRTLDIVLYTVQFQPITFDGPTYKDGLRINYAGRALMSAVDETGAALPEPAIGRLVSRPPAS